MQIFVQKEGGIYFIFREIYVVYVCMLIIFKAMKKQTTNNSSYGRELSVQRTHNLYMCLSFLLISVVNLFVTDV